MEQFHATTIVCVRRGNRVALGGDGQVTLGNIVIKGTARKIRRLYHDKILAGFAGATADAFTLQERFEAKLEKHQGNLMRAAVELTRDWRTDRVLRRLEAMLIVADAEHTLVLTGNGDVLEPEHGLAAIGSGGAYAQSAALALLRNTDLPPETIIKQSLEIAGDLRRAIRDGGLTVAYQPIFDAGTRAIIGVEALIRWYRPQLGPLPPAVFVPIAEQSGLIDELGEWTIRRACLDALAWPSIKVSVNVSPAQFRNPNFENQLTAILRETGFPVSRLDLEVTESYFIANSDQARRAIDVIRGLGISVSLDDFGTGYSSIGCLRSFNFDKLKLDRSLIIGLARDERVLRLVEATIALAGALDLEVTAEGVETEVEATLLQNAGCVAFQGFFFAKPMPAPAIAALIRSLGGVGQPSPQPGSGRHAQLGHPG